MTAVATAPAAPAQPKTRRPTAATQVAGTALLIFSTVLLGFAVYIGLISDLRYDRAQHTAYANFRTELAQAVAPTGPTVPGSPHTLLPLGAPVAVLGIPAIGVHDVVFEGTTGGVLRNGPGHLRDTVLPGQAGVSELLGRAAAFGGPFGRLGQLDPGDSITVTTGQGVARFSVIDIRRAGDPEPPLVPAGKGRLELATADGPPYLPSGVLRVDADLVSPTQPTAAPAFTGQDLPAAEVALGTDPSAWYGLVLWGQALLVAAAVLTWARTRWGRWQVWVVAVPVLAFFGFAVADQASELLINLL